MTEELFGQQRPVPASPLEWNTPEPVAGYLAAAYAAVIVVTVVAARLLGKVPRRPLLVALILTFAHKVGKALAIVFSGNSLGLAIGAQIGTALDGFLGWRAA